MLIAYHITTTIANYFQIVSHLIHFHLLTSVCHQLQLDVAESNNRFLIPYSIALFISISVIECHIFLKIAKNNHYF